MRIFRFSRLFLLVLLMIAVPAVSFAGIFISAGIARLRCRYIRSLFAPVSVISGPRVIGHTGRKAISGYPEPG